MNPPHSSTAPHVQRREEYKTLILRIELVATAIAQHLSVFPDARDNRDSFYGRILRGLKRLCSRRLGSQSHIASDSVTFSNVRRIINGAYLLPVCWILDEWHQSIMGLLRVHSFFESYQHCSYTEALKQTASIVGVPYYQIHQAISDQSFDPVTVPQPGPQENQYSCPSSLPAGLPTFPQTQYFSAYPHTPINKRKVAPRPESTPNMAAGRATPQLFEQSKSPRPASVPPQPLKSCREDPTFSRKLEQRPQDVSETRNPKPLMPSSPLADSSVLEVSAKSPHSDDNDVVFVAMRRSAQSLITENHGQAQLRAISTTPEVTIESPREFHTSPPPLVTTPTVMRSPIFRRQQNDCTSRARLNVVVTYPRSPSHELQNGTQNTILTRKRVEAYLPADYEIASTALITTPPGFYASLLSQISGTTLLTSKSPDVFDEHLTTLFEPAIGRQGSSSGIEENAERDGAKTWAKQTTDETWKTSAVQNEAQTFDEDEKMKNETVSHDSADERKMPPPQTLNRFKYRQPSEATNGDKNPESRASTFPPCQKTSEITGLAVLPGDNFVSKSMSESTAKKMWVCWMRNLLHAAACAKTDSSTCPRTCAATKSLLRHIEKCKDYPCAQKGCYDARCMISHFRSCRSSLCRKCSDARVGFEDVQLPPIQEITKKEHLLNLSRQRVLLMCHASSCVSSKCRYSAGIDKLPCAKAKQLLDHMKSCTTPNCDVKYCTDTRKVMEHFNSCKRSACILCSFVRSKIEDEESSSASLPNQDGINPAPATKSSLPLKKRRVA